MTENPFREKEGGRQSVAPCVVVIFGATGDLTHRKLVPALYNLSVDTLLPSNFHLIGFARRDWTDDHFREGLRDNAEKHSRRKPIDESTWSEFAKHTTYLSSAFDDEKGYAELREQLEKIDSESGSRCTRLFYFATSPNYFELVAKNLKGAGLLEESDKERTRVIVEKPFGHDLESARELNTALLRCMPEEQIFRIDHYLGKETVQNLLVFRFSNGMFEPIWNHKYISYVEISVCESIGVGSRAGYFDTSGILRDIVQNHAFQLLCLVAMEPPTAFSADSVRDEKVKVLKSIRRIPVDEIGSNVVRARYLNGSTNGEPVQGYLAEDGVDPDSTTETYVAMKLDIDNWRWAGVPFYVRSAKRLPKRVTEIAIHFKTVPHLLFSGENVDTPQPNVLSFQIQPDEGISIKMNSKPPGPQVRVQPVKMDFHYGTSFAVGAPEAYERLLLDGMKGDATLFTRDDEIEQAWDILQNVFAAWDQPEHVAPAVYGYESGTWGPKVANELIMRHAKTGWRRL